MSHPNTDAVILQFKTQIDQEYETILALIEEKTSQGLHSLVVEFNTILQPYLAQVFNKMSNNGFSLSYVGSPIKFVIIEW